MAGSPLWTGQKQNTKGAFLDASSMGINSVSGLSQMEPTECIYTYNLMPDEFGMRLRRGYNEWANGVVGEIRTIIPYDGTEQDTSQDKLFACSEDGIYDVTLEGTTLPNKELDFLIKNNLSGQGVFTHFVDESGASFVLYADEANGLFEYTESTGIWAQAPDPTAPTDPVDTPPLAVDVVFIMSHKSRLWFVGRSQADVWYFPPGSKDGIATRFTLGGKLKHGGEALGLWNWTIDGGDGFDDYLVIISRAGDVVVYRGRDVSLAGSWDQVGSWFVGEMPAGRRVASEYGGELNVLCSMGVISLRDLLLNSSQLTENSPSYKISRQIRGLINSFKAEPSWQLKHNPADNFLTIVIPLPASERPIQYAMDLTTKAWGIMRDMPAVCTETWKGEYFFGTTDGRVFQYSGTRDGVLLDGTQGETIKFSMLTSYQTIEEPSLYKRIQFTRVKGITAGATGVTVRPIYDFVVNPIIDPPSPVAINPADTWDVGVWDTAVWGGVQGNAESVRGGRNMGIHVALAMRGEAANRVTLVGWDVMWDTGGLL